MRTALPPSVQVADFVDNPEAAMTIGAMVRHAMAPPHGCLVYLEQRRGSLCVMHSMRPDQARAMAAALIAMADACAELVPPPDHDAEADHE